MEAFRNVKIQWTYDYSKFKFFESNREPTHVNKIVESIEKQDLTPYKPIMVDKNYYIVDGQNRFLACMQLNKPIYNIAPIKKDQDLVSEESMAILNSYQKNWNLAQYLHMWTCKGIQDYIAISDIIKQTGLSVHNIIIIWRVEKVEEHGRKAATKVFKDGEYEFGEDAASRVLRVAKVYNAVLENTPKSVKLSNKSRLVAGINTALMAGPDIDKLIKKIEKHPSLIEVKATADKYRQMLEHIYNYHSKTGRQSLKYQNIGNARAAI